MTARRLTAILSGAFAAVVLAACWLLFAPTQLGGGTSYAILVGTSMEPRLHRGDLAIVRRSPAYRVGDVVLYESRDLGANVLHRIERVERGRFVLKGDNNDFLDPERPTEEQIVGALWLHVPAVGRLSTWLREPLHAGLFIGAVAFVVLGGLGAGAASARRGPRSVPAPKPRRQPPLQRRRLERDRAALYAAPIVAAIACLALVVVSYTRPLVAAESNDGAYAHQGRFAYEADVAANAVYPNGGVRTGDPIFARLVPRLRIAFDYRLEAPPPVTLRGTIRLDARVADGRGWQRVLPLATERRFSGGEARAAGTLDIERIQRIVDEVRELTGSPQAAYTVAVVPSVVAAGRIGREPIQATFEPALVFELAEQRLQPSVSPGGEGVGPFAPRESVRGTRLVAASLTVGPFAVPVATMRKLSLAGLAGLLLLAGSILVRPRGSREEHAAIASRYGHLLVSVRPPASAWADATELADFEALVRIAVQHGRLILHVADAAGHAYVVEDGPAVYRYRAERSVLQAAPEAHVPHRRAGALPAVPQRLADGDLIPGGGGARYRSPRRFGLRRRHAA